MTEELVGLRHRRKKASVIDLQESYFIIFLWFWLCLELSFRPVSHKFGSCMRDAAVLPASSLRPEPVFLENKPQREDKFCDQDIPVNFT